jgi:hypothetical protein
LSDEFAWFRMPLWTGRSPMGIETFLRKNAIHARLTRDILSPFRKNRNHLLRRLIPKLGGVQRFHHDCPFFLRKAVRWAIPGAMAAVLATVGFFLPALIRPFADPYDLTRRLKTSASEASLPDVGQRHSSLGF